MRDRTLDSRCLMEIPLEGTKPSTDCLCCQRSITSASSAGLWGTGLFPKSPGGSTDHWCLQDFLLFLGSLSSFQRFQKVPILSFPQKYLQSIKFSFTSFFLHWPIQLISVQFGVWWNRGTHMCSVLMRENYTNYEYIDFSYISLKCYIGPSSWPDTHSPNWTKAWIWQLALTLTK